MTTEKFNEVVDLFIWRVQSMLKKKASEYNLEDDRLGVFKRAATLQHETPAQALIGMKTKHTISIADWVNSEIKPTESLLLEKLTDEINYDILLYAIYKEAGFAEEVKKNDQ